MAWLLNQFVAEGFHRLISLEQTVLQCIRGSRGAGEQIEAKGREASEALAELRRL